MPIKFYQEQPISTDPTTEKRCKTIAIAAGKGGVGKSSLTANLALALKKKGFCVGVLDADLYGPSMRKMLPEDRPPAQKGQMIYPAVCSGINMISMAYFRKESEASAIRAPIANSIIQQFTRHVTWGELDYLLVDFPPGTGDIQISLAQQLKINGAIMVTTPQEVALLDVRKAIHLFNQMHVPILGIVENMSYYEHPTTQEKLYLFGKGGGSRLARDMGTPLLGEIPIQPILSQCADAGQSIFTKCQDLEAQRCCDQFLKLAERVRLHLEYLDQFGDEEPFNELIWRDLSA